MKKMWNLLQAYEWNPAAFKDNANIPESGNGVPDLLVRGDQEARNLREEAQATAPEMT
jgi:hypothetical protein